MQLVNHQGQLLTEDTATAARTLADQLGQEGFDLRLWKAQGEGPLSLVPAGRELELTVSGAEAQQGLTALWARAIPLGFSPWARFPVKGKPGVQVFHFFGPWRNIQEHLISEGRGEHAWPSLCAAAHCDVDLWKGTGCEIRMVQAHLHRLGFNPGVVDGVMGDRTIDSIHLAGLEGQDFDDVARYLSEALPTWDAEVTVGHLVLPGRQLEVSTFGAAKAKTHANGAALQVDGPGRFVVDVR